MKKGFKYVLLAVCIMALMSTTALAANGTIGGSGTEDTPYLIEDLADLEAFRDAVNNGNSYEGKTVALANSITLTGEWTPIGNGSRSDSTYTGNAFKGVFDGKGKEIFGLTITTGEASAALGLFGVVDGGTVKDLTLTDVSINVAANKNAGAAIGLMVNNATADGIDVSGSITAADGAGGVVGRMTISGTISGCTSSATVTTSGGGAGGIVGKAYYTGENKVMTISGCTNSGAVTSGYVAGGIAGLSAADVSGCTNTAAITAATEAGGIVGEQVNRGTVSGNNNSGIVSNNTTGGTAYGGIIGWIRYQASASDYPTAANEVITVSDNTNSGAISASGATLGSGGIVGTIYNQANVTGNTNTAASVTGGVFAAGIVGGAQHSADNVVIANETISVTNNVSTTALSAISATNVAFDMYNNDPDSFVAKNNGEAWAAQIVGGAKYLTLKDAIANAADGDTVELLASYSDWKMIQIGRSIVIDLNGFNINRTFGGAAVDITDGTVTITGEGTISGSTTGVLVAYDAALVVGEGVTVEGRDGHGIDNDGVLTIDGATITGTEYGVAHYEGTLTMNSGSVTGKYGIAAYTDTTVTIKDGTVTGTTAGLSGHGEYHGTTFIIEGGTIQSEAGVGIYHPQNGILTITGGTIQGATGINMKSGTLSVTGGTIKGTGDKVDYSFVGGGFAPTGDALVIESCGYPGGAPVVSIEGGIFTSDKANSVASYTGNGVTDVVSDFIAGGIYSDTSAEDYLAPDYVLDSYVDGSGNTVYGVEPSVNISFDPGEGTGTMAPVVVPAGDYVLPACGFTAPDGKQFMAWNVNGVVKLAGATVTITSDTALVALWEEEGHTCVPTGWKNDKDHHWKDCWEIGCFETSSYGAHTDANNDGRCDTCSYDMAANKPASPTTGENNNVTFWLIAMVAASAVCAVLLLTNKRYR